MNRLFDRKRALATALIVGIGVVAFLYSRGRVPRPVLLTAIAAGLLPLLIKGIRDLVREHRVGTEIFICAATVIALLGGEYVAASLLLTIILIAEFIADLNTDRARMSIKALVGAVPRTATRRVGSGEEEIAIDALAAGDVVIVKAGGKVPVDGVVTGGAAAVDESTMTGESVPVERGPGSSVLAGTVVTSGAIDVRVERVGADTAFGRILHLVEDADSSQAPIQKLTDRVAAWLLPAVGIFLAGVWFVTHDVRKVVALLVFTSPAELGLATPIVMIAAIARAARLGILVKGGLYLEQLAKVDTVVFDKTGTLTLGQPSVETVHVYGEHTDRDVVYYAAAADRRSAHPLAAALVREATRRNYELPPADDFRTIHGRGVVATIEAREVLVGNAALLDQFSVSTADLQQAGGMAIHVAINGQAAGTISFRDEIRPGAREALAQLRTSGIREFAILTGDNDSAARAVGDALGISDVRSGLLPDQKIEEIQKLRLAGRRVAMVGDGVNDAPALAQADVGIAMGARGTQAAIEAADIALMTDDLSRIALARLIARKAYRTIQENLIVGVGVVHVLGITAALLGWIGPVQAALLHLVPDVLVFLNSIKLLRVRLTPAV